MLGEVRLGDFEGALVNLIDECKIQWLRFSISILAARGRSFTLTEGTPRPLKAFFSS